jgi:hypothetical protein
MKTEGGCLCKAVRFSVGGPPITTRVCWCRLCQHLSGGNGMVSVCFHSESLKVKGGFCPTCGTPLFSKTEARPHLIFIRAGALDDPNLMAPQQTIWTDEAPDWACFDPDVPRVPGQPPPPK